MRELTVNGETFAVAAATVDALLTELGYESAYVAVAVNRTCVRRRDYATAHLNPGDEVEVLAPMSGG